MIPWSPVVRVGQSSSVNGFYLNDQHFLGVRLQYVCSLSPVILIQHCWNIIISNNKNWIDFIPLRSCLSDSQKWTKPSYTISYQNGFVDSISSFPAFNQFLAALLVDSLGWMNRAGFVVLPPIYWFRSRPFFSSTTLNCISPHTRPGWREKKTAATFFINPRQKNRGCHFEKLVLRQF